MSLSKFWGSWFKSLGDAMELSEIDPAIVEKYEKQKQEFLNDLFELYKKHNITISHEDCQGSFELEFHENDDSMQRDKNWISSAVIVVTNSDFDKLKKGE